jgi:hypothetical protein
MNGPDWDGAVCREHYPDLWFPEAGLGTTERERRDLRRARRRAS